MQTHKRQHVPPNGYNNANNSTQLATSSPAQTTMPMQHQAATLAVPTPALNGHVNADANVELACVTV
jgi:hypothetical protein